MKLRPMLGAVVEDIRLLHYPLLASYKLDGVRALWNAPEFFSRTLKTLPNRTLQKLMKETGLKAGYDGEIIVGEPNAKDVFRRTTSAVMSLNSVETDFKFFIFDRWDIPRTPFAERNAALGDFPPIVVKIDQIWVHNADEVEELWLKAVTSGYEGLILREPGAQYKYGRSTLREQGLLKVKRFLDAEAKVVGFEELMHNANEATIDERGYTKRSSHVEGKVASGILGALVCTFNGAEFRIGTGFTHADRVEIWRNQDRFLGSLAKFKYLNVGIKTLPRHPVFLGWRDARDL